MKVLLIIVAVLGMSMSFPQAPADSGGLRSLPVNVKENRRLKLSDIASDVRKVTPEFSEESAFGRVDKLVLCNDGFLVQAPYDNVLLFNDDGKFVRRIGDQWTDHSLFNVNFIDITFDGAEGIIYISTLRNGVLKFGLDGSYKGSINHLPRPEGLQFSNNTLYGIPSTAPVKIGNKYRNQAQLFTYSLKENQTDSVKIWTIFQDYGIISGTSIKDFISVVDNQVYVSYPCLYTEAFARDTLYKYQGKELLPAMKLDFGNEAGPGPSGIKQIQLGHICVVGNYVFADYVYKKEDYFYLYDLRIGSGSNMKQGLRDNMTHCGIISIRPLGDNRFYYTHREESEDDRNVDIYIGTFK